MKLNHRLRNWSLLKWSSTPINKITTLLYLQQIPAQKGIHHHGVNKYTQQGRCKEMATHNWLGGTTVTLCCQHKILWLGRHGTYTSWQSIMTRDRAEPIIVPYTERSTSLSLYLHILWKLFCSQIFVSKYAWSNLSFQLKHNYIISSVFGRWIIP